MAEKPFSKVFKETDRIVITRTELRRRLLPHNFMVKLYARHPDGTPNLQVSLDADQRGCEVDGEGTLTIHLLTPRSGMVFVLPITPPTIMR